MRLPSPPADLEARTQALLESLEERILVLDGATGTALQGYDLSAADFGGAELEGCNENLCRTRPDVVRGVSETNGNELVRLDEVRGIERKDGIIAAGDRRFTGNERVSMNFWAFQPGMMAELRREYDAFSRDHDSTHEMLLPVTVDRLITEGRIKVRVLDAPGPWIGLTHASDLPGARQALEAAAARGDYKTPLWGAQ